ncbi:MAG: hypothetical protein ACERJ2_15190, partial [Filomicrobium sp.]
NRSRLTLLLCLHIAQRVGHQPRKLLSLDAEGLHLGSAEKRTERTRRSVLSYPNRTAGKRAINRP